ncbi:hypothetical protein NG99_25085 [Erwinia typographi]|uniref:DUF305 domain-containing protein n=1 Tax=Erwinia typographi TaxID=371042 RepID=A0A0A3YJ66_9GAMM|nr:DUF305 domain-containing protein [Erwinia typographi]KGT86685.1 hypothetical protein NG99_25085 [Erwinia typographi]
MNRLLCGIVTTLMLSGSALAADNMAMPMDSAKQTSSQKSYQAGMDEMHHDMTAGMQEKDPDRAFAKGMIAHHQGAIAMAKTELQYGKDPAMRKLAEEIIKAQQPEIEQMQGWLSRQKKE